MKNKMQPNIQCNKKDISKLVLMPGDPGRVVYIAKNYLLKGKIISRYREFTVAVGFYKNQKITVVSTGIGCPSTAIATEEIINLGAKILIRVGTCGGALKKEIKPGSIIIPSACIREEGTTKEYIPYQFPAVADPEILLALKQASEKLKYKSYIGINRTHDAFYGQARNIKQWGSIYLDPRMRNWPYPVISSEMETSALFIIALMRGVKAGCVLAVNAEPEPLDLITQNKFAFSTPVSKINSKEAKKSVDKAIMTALEAIITIIS